MKKSISGFRSMFKNGFARATRYAVTYGDKTLFPETVTLPSKTVSTYTHSLFGPTIQYPYRENFNDNIVLTFPEDANGNMRMFWEGNMTQTSGGSAFPSNLDTQVANLTISQLSLNDTEIAKYDVFGAYPLSLVPVNMGYAMVNETTKVQVMIKYYMYEYHQSGSGGHQIAAPGHFAIT